MKTIKILVVVLTVLLAFTISIGKAENKNAGLTDIILCLDWPTNTNHARLFVSDAESQNKEVAQILAGSNNTTSLDEADELGKMDREFLSKDYMRGCDHWSYIDSSYWNFFYQWLKENDLAIVKIADNTGFTNNYLPG